MQESGTSRRGRRSCCGQWWLLDTLLLFAPAHSIISVQERLVDVGWRSALLVGPVLYD
jgi:hypothetical protein